ncbi:hypothetical protein [Labrenzia sp. OB1]|uniref:hypothetical protein n=1 Tax=Labrenzia sp. OB1 TaxID=1561204 RepID=UPI0007B2008D|nr:hypothetical protein [Labrenzia sp. OB1]KZM48258.1 hypothetical protein OA90_21100 [Labrenzia sp. OB1]
MTNGMSLQTANQTIDPTTAVLWASHPEGPPADIYEPREPADKVITRVRALEWFGMFAAVEAFPELFFETREGRGC